MPGPVSSLPRSAHRDPATEARRPLSLQPDTSLSFSARCTPSSASSPSRGATRATTSPTPARLSHGALSSYVTLPPGRLQRDRCPLTPVSTVQIPGSTAAEQGVHSTCPSRRERAIPPPRVLLVLSGESLRPRSMIRFSLPPPETSAWWNAGGERQEAIPRMVRPHCGGDARRGGT